LALRALVCARFQAAVEPAFSLPRRLSAGMFRGDSACTLAATALVSAVLAAGCGQSPKPPAEKAAAAPVQYFHVDAATAATVSGRIVYHGSRPARTVISMDADAHCEQANGNRPVYNEPVLTGKGGGLANAFVYVQAGLEGKKFEPPKEAILLDQRGCMF